MTKDQLRATIYGHAVGDALGLPVQFKPHYSEYYSEESSFG